MIASIRARFNTKHVIRVFKTKAFVVKTVFQLIVIYKCSKIKNLWCTGDHIPCSPLKDFQVAYIITNLGESDCFYFVVHAACYCMGAICLNGNVWINCLYTKVSVSCESMTIQLLV